MRVPARRIAALLVCAGVVLGACGDAEATSQAPTEAPAEPTPVVIDTDLDLSDVGAIVGLVLDPSVDVLAITITDTGTGVTRCGSARKVMGYILDELGRSEIPYACGGAAAGDDALVFPAGWRTAADAGWGMAIPPRPESGTPESAVDLLTRTVGEATEPIKIVALGPWTNLAAAASTDAAFLDGVEEIHAMAAAVDAPGNVFVDDVTSDDHLEWNVVLDPSAFVAIVRSDVPITLVPLDATQDVPVTEGLKARLGESEAGGANLVYELWVRVPGRIGEGQQLWDELAALTLGDPGLVSWEDLTLAVEANGQLKRDDAGREMRVAMSASPSAVDDAFVTALDRGGSRATPFALQGTMSIAWDGATCTAELSQDVAAGVTGLELTNSSGEPGGVSIIGVVGDRTWSDLVEFVATFDPETTDEQPDWIVVAGSVGDETGGSATVRGTAIVEAGTYGPVCLTGAWPDIRIAAGEAFEVAP